MSSERAFIKAADAAAGFRSHFEAIPLGPVAYGSLGNNTATVAGSVIWSEIYIEQDCTIAGIKILNGATVGTDKGIAALYSNTGDLLASSAVAGALTAGANALQDYTLVTAYAAKKGRHFIAYQSNGATDTVRTVAASTYINSLNATATGAFGTLPQLVVPTTFTANTGPIGAAHV